MSNHIMICDVDSMVFATAFAMKDSPIQEAINSLENYITGVANACSAESVLICMTEGKSWRKDYGKTREYKGNRKFREIPEHLNPLRNHLKEHWNPYFEERWEADDLIFVARTEYNKKYPDSKIFLATNDKDCLQYPGNFVDFKKSIFFTVTEEQALKSLWTQMITGDTADNIPGIEGIGPVGAEKILSQVTPNQYPETVLRAYIAKYKEKEGIDRFYESYNLLKLIDNCEEAGLDPTRIPEPKKVSYEYKTISETSSENSPTPF